MSRIFLLSPANSAGVRAGYLLRPQAQFELARRVQSRQGAPLGEAFAFMSGLYFRGKLVYARAFAPDRSLVITPNAGLVPIEQRVTARTLRRYAEVAIRHDEPRFARPLARDAHRIAAAYPELEVVLLGSIASKKYVEVLTAVFGDRLLFPIDFVGRGDMSRGGLLLRAARDRRELPYQPVAGSTRHGARPPRLAPVPGILRQAMRSARRS